MEDGLVQSYRDLRVWNEAMVLAETCYRHTRNFPKDELFGLTSQIRPQRRPFQPISLKGTADSKREPTFSSCELRRDRARS
jgi:hypothetical protein